MEHNDLDLEDGQTEPEYPPYDPKEMEGLWARIRGVVIILLSLVAAGAIVLCCVQGRRLDKNTGRIKDAERQVLEVQEQAEEAEAEAELQSRWNRYLWDKIDFYEKNCVLVTKSGKKYHSYGCTSLSEGTEYRILNVEAALAQGYTPCSRCGPPEGAETDGGFAVMGPVVELELPAGH